MSCEQFSALLDAMENHALTAEQRAAMDKHALECPDCALLLALRTLDEEVTAPDTCGYSWRRAVRNESAKRTRKPRKAFQALCAAAAVVVFLCGGTLLTRGMGWNLKSEPIATEGDMPFLAPRTREFIFESNGALSFDAENMPDTADTPSGSADDMPDTGDELSESAEAPTQDDAPDTTFLHDMRVFLTLSAPYLIILAVLAAAAILLRRHHKRRATQHKEENP